MARLTVEQIAQKKQQLKQLAGEMKAITQELAESGAISIDSPLATEGTQELSEDELDGVAGGFDVWKMISSLSGKQEKK